MHCENRNRNGIKKKQGNGFSFIGTLTGNLSKESLPFVPLIFPYLKRDEMPREACIMVFVSAP